MKRPGTVPAFSHIHGHLSAPPIGPEIVKISLQCLQAGENTDVSQRII